MIGGKMKLEKLEKYLGEATNWKNDPWGAREELVKRVSVLGNKIDESIQPSETQFFYDKNTKHINRIGKQITTIDKALTGLEKAIETAIKIKA
jgi:hypothetical protein